MSGVQFFIMAIVAAIVTLPIVILIPRARQSAAFDRVLWGATWLLAFLGAWYAVDNYVSGARLGTLVFEEFVQAAGGALVSGALVGALSLNVLLWLMDRFAGLAADEVGEDVVEEDQGEEKYDGASSDSH
jgi:hypothetical protein